MVNKSKKKKEEPKEKISRGTPKGNTGPLEKNETKRECRLFAFTSYNEIPPIITDNIQYIGWGEEICPDTGRDHLQGFVYFKKRMILNSARKRLKECHPFENYKPCNMRVCDGTFEQNVKYCSKDGKYTEFGEKPSPGARTDLKIIRDRINQGESVDKLTEENPYLYHMYGRTMTKLEDINARKKWRKEVTNGIWYYGSTGVGKSHKAFENYNEETHYVLPNDNGWWDAYRQQETVIINDFRGELTYNELLQLVDKWPFHVKRRNREPLPFISKQVIITSSLKPEEIYKNRNKEDQISQLLRRFEIIKIEDKDM